MATCAAPTSLRFEHLTESCPVLGIGTPAPRLSWVTPAAEADYKQSAYEVELTYGDGSVQVESVQSREQILVPWPGRPLESRESCAVRLRVSGDGPWSAWSEPAELEAGLLRAEDWAGNFVSPVDIGRVGSPAPILRGTFDIPANATRARLYVTSFGIHEASLNGQKVGDHLLAPGWTSYRHRLRYETFDVTGSLKPGENVLDILLGNGWYRGRLGWEGKRALYGDRLAALGQLEVTAPEGHVQVFATNENWTAREGAVRSDDLYDGQRLDLRRLVNNEGEDAASKVEVVDADLDILVSPDGPPVRVTEVLPAVEVFTSPAGATLVDFGQNLVGWVRLRVRGLAEGAEVLVRHAEVLEDGELGVRPLRSALATDSYLVAGMREETLEPSLTFHGFRYAEVSGVMDLRAEDVEAVVIGTDLRRAGWFSSSHKTLDRLHENVVWGMRGNFLDVPTDCPQRDERLGWTGDIQVFCPTASFLFDSAGFLTSWLADLAAEQGEDGAVPFVIPDILGRKPIATAVWGDAATLVPWVVYQRTGDTSLLARQLPSMRAWVDHVAQLAGSDRLWSGGFQFGDWLDPTAPPDQPFEAKADPDVIATASLARSAEILAMTCEISGDTASAEHYSRLATEVRAAFAREYVTANGRILSDAQTVYGLALNWALLPSEDQRARAGRRLADLVRISGFRISTGFVGTPLIADALTSVGEIDLAYRLLLQTECPSWLYAVTMGATTVWERWDSMLPDGSINPGEMTSFNHYALGAVADWLHRTVAGLAPAEPGYRRLDVHPRPGGGLAHASARHLTPYGEASVMWHRADGSFRLDLVVPVGSTATVRLPGHEDAVEVGHGAHSWEVEDVTDDGGAGRRIETVRGLLDDEPKWRSVVAAAQGVGAATDERQAALRLAPFLDSPPSVIPDALTAFGMEANPDALRRQIRLLSAGSTG